MIDFCTRYTRDRIATDRTTRSILQGRDEMWIRPFGPPRVLESDQEGGLISDEDKLYPSRSNIELKEKG
eukprot:1647288-Prorocentrum_lima.AAC.1